MLEQIPADSLRRVLDRTFAGRAYDWNEAPHPFAFLTRWWNALTGWLAQLREQNPVAFELLLWGLVTALLLVVVHAVWIMYRTVRAASAPSPGQLPVERAERRDAAWYGRESARLAQGGRYREAIQAEFAALILQLDAQRRVRFHPSKTPHEYTAEPTLEPPARERLARLVRALYRYVFAHDPCGPEEYDRWRAEASGLA